MRKFMVGLRDDLQATAATTEQTLLKLFARVAAAAELRVPKSDVVDSSAWKTTAAH